MIYLIGEMSVYAQGNISNLFVSNTYKGDEMFLDLYYDQAVKYYKLALKRNNDNNKLKLKIANSYRLLSDYESSLIWYEQVLNDSSDLGDPIDKYHYAEVLLTSGRTDDAEDWYKKYYMAAPTDSRAFTKYDGINRIQALFSDSTAMNVDRLPINSEFNELAAKPYKKGLVFLSSKTSNSLVDHDYLREENLLDLYYVEYDSSLGWQPSKSFDKAINTGFHEGPIAFYDDDKKLILTRSNVVGKTQIKSKNGSTNLQLFNVELSGGSWSKIKSLSFNNPEFSYAHPSLSAGADTLYFSSDMEGGYGGNDIYMSIGGGDTWSEPVNLGYLINTEGDEMYPYFIDDRLFFSSNGRLGLGGLDIYKAFILDGRIADVVNLGYPINSSQDDFAYYLDDKTLSGNLTSNRLGSLGKNDIYSFNYVAHILTGLVAQEQDGTVIPDAIVKLIQGDSILATTTTDEQGLFHFQLPIGSDFILEVVKDDHYASLPLGVASRKSSIDLDTLKINLHKHDLFAGGRILNNETQQLMPNVRVILQDLSTNKFDTLITDESGLYKFVLNPMKDYSIYAGKTGFLLGGVDINTKSITQGTILNDIVLELEYEKKGVVHFDYNKYNLKPETLATLKRAAKAMKNTANKLVISAYADARGTVEYNQKLSDKRANAVLNYMVRLGVSKSRITARGFGETLMLNRCVDGVHCEEIEHSKNRRAEIKIEGSTVR